MITITRNSRARTQRLAGRIAWAALLVLLIIVVVFPVYWMVSSVLGAESAFTWPPHLLPRHLVLTPFVTILSQRPVARWFANTTAVAGGTTLLTLLVGIPCGLSLSRFNSRTNRNIAVTMLVSQMLPASLLAIPMYVLFARVGLLDSLGGLVIADTAFSVPLAVWMLKGFFDSIPSALEEAAMVDGCTPFAAYMRIIVPLATPGIVAVAIFAFMTSWGELFFAQTLINSASRWTLSVGLSSFHGEFSLDWSGMLAAATLFAIPPVLLFLGLQRFLISGLTGGAVKG